MNGVGEAGVQRGGPPQVLGTSTILWKSGCDEHLFVSNEEIGTSMTFQLGQIKYYNLTTTNHYKPRR